MARFGVVALGDLNCDLILVELENPPVPNREILAQSYNLTLGGSTGIFAAVSGGLGAKVGFVGLLGRDYFGDFLHARLAEYGVDTGGIRRERDILTGLTVSLVREGERALVTVLGSIAGLRSEDLPWDYIRQGRHLHLASYYLQTCLRPEIGGILAAARQAGMTTSLDPGWDPREEWDWPAVAALLPDVDIFLPNETEALHLIGTADINAALAAMLAAGAGIVAVKQGAEGAIAGRGAERVKAPPLRINVVDTTGAGDSFDAGFVHAYLQGNDLASCLGFANASGALAACRVGGADGAPTADDVISFMHAAARRRV